MPYEEIQERFGTLDSYIHTAVGAPLIVADDDISGTFGFAPWKRAATPSP